MKSMSPTEWTMLKDQCELFLESGFLPKAVSTLPKALFVATKGRELGLDLMASFHALNVIQGKVTLSAEALLSLVLKNCPGATVDFIEISDTACEIVASRKQGGPRNKFRFSSEDAKKAGLWGRPGPWKMFPRAMLRSRCVSELCRSMFPDCISNCYTPDEIGGVDSTISYEIPQHIAKEQAEIPTPEQPIEASVPAVAQRAKNPFDKHDANQLKVLRDMLIKKGVDLEDVDQISKLMHGRFSVDIDKVLTEWYSSVLSDEEAAETTEEKA